MVILIAGCGWLGCAIGAALVARGDRVLGVRRDPGAAGRLVDLGIEPVILDLLASGAAKCLPSGVDAVMACQAATERSVESYRRTYVEVNRVLLDAAPKIGASRLVYTSSTGVFGQSDGCSVDESTPPRPAAGASEQLVAAEEMLTDRSGAPLSCVVRLSGLYGPGRYGVIDRVRRGELALGPGDDVWMNWCHRDDAVRTVLAALDGGRPGAVYHGTDDAPTKRGQVVRWIAERLGIEPPTGPGGGARANRRVLGDRTRAELGVTLAYPSFRDGLEAALAGRR